MVGSRSRSRSEADQGHRSSDVSGRRLLGRDKKRRRRDQQQELELELERIRQDYVKYEHAMLPYGD